MPDVPDKDFYKLNEVCQYTDTQPYVLRFWESEFPQLHPTRGRGGQPVYRREDIDLVMQIKRLLYDEECSIAAARERLEQDTNGRRRATGRRRAARRSDAAAEAAAPEALGTDPAFPAEVASSEGVPRERYEDALAEIERIRFELREAERRQRKLEASLERAEGEAGRERERAARAAARIEKLLGSL